MEARNGPWRGIRLIERAANPKPLAPGERLIRTPHSLKGMRLRRREFNDSDPDDPVPDRL